MKKYIPNDQCPECGTEMDYDGGDLGDHMTPQTDPALYCTDCGFNTGEIDWDCFDYKTKQFRRIHTGAQRERAEAVREALENVSDCKTFTIDSMFEHAPDGDFKWDADEAGDWHVYSCGEKDCDRQWHKIAYATSLKRENGKRSIEYASCDEDGDWDCISEWTDDDASEETWILQEMANESRDYFAGWARYHLHCFFDGTDVLGECEVGTPPEKHLKHAEGMVKHLK